MEIKNFIQAQQEVLQIEKDISQLTEKFEIAVKDLRLKLDYAKRYLSALDAGVSPEYLSIGKTVIKITGKYKGGSGAQPSVIRDAIIDLAEHRGSRLKQEYFGTKNYSQWTNQRSDHPYGYGPKHGNIVFSIGLQPEVRERELLDDELCAAIYCLRNIDKVQEALIFMQGQSY